MEKIKNRPTPKKELRNLMRKIQRGRDIFLNLSKRKRHKRKNRDAYDDLMLLKGMILRGYFRQLRIDSVQKWKSTILGRNELLSKSLRGRNEHSKTLLW